MGNRLAIGSFRNGVEHSHRNDCGTRQRQAFRAGWLAALRNEAHLPPQKNVDLDSRWSQGFHDGTRLRQAWKKTKLVRAI